MKLSELKDYDIFMFVGKGGPDGLFQKQEGGVFVRLFFSRRGANVIVSPINIPNETAEFGDLDAEVKALQTVQ